MKTLRRQVALFLLTGLLPLMADDETDMIHSAEPIHDDALRALPALPMELPPNALLEDSSSGNTNNDNDNNNGTMEDPWSSVMGHNWSLCDSSLQPCHDRIPEDSDAEPVNFEDELPDMLLLEEKRITEQSSSLSERDPVAEGDKIDDQIKESVIHREQIIDQTETSNEEETLAVEDEDGLVQRVAVDYASKSAGALILEKSSSMKGTSNLLNDDKDKYAIAPCEDKKFVVIGLSEDILVKQVQLANYERYSSHVQTFQILGSQTMGDWVDLGTYEAHAGNGEQAFDLLDPSWARYLKFRFLSHFGMEYYCTISQIKVHGSTMLQGFHEQWNHVEKSNRGIDINGQQTPAILLTTVDSSPDVEPAGSHMPTQNDVRQEDDSIVSPAETILIETRSEVKDNADDAPKDPTDNAADALNNSTPKTPKPIKDPEPIILVDEEIKKRLVTALLLPDIPAETSVTMERPAPKVSALDSQPIGTLHVVNDALKALVENASGAMKHVAKEAPDDMGKIQQKIKSTFEAVVDNDSESPSLENVSEMEIANHAADHTAGDSEISARAGVANDQVEKLRDPLENFRPETPAIVDEVPELEAGKEPPGMSTNALDVNSPEIKSTEDSSHEPFGYDVPEGLVDALGRFPSAKCLEKLSDTDLLASKASAKAAVTNGQNSGSNARMEPIFKTLTMEIKLLQVSQSVQDQFSKSLVSCYQSIILDMAKEFDSLQLDQESRLSRLEAEMKSMKSSGLVFWFASFAAFLQMLLIFVGSQLVNAGNWLSVVLGCGIRLAYRGYLIAPMVLKDSWIQLFVDRVRFKESEAVLILAGSFVIFILFVTVLAKLWMPRRRATRKYSTERLKATTVHSTPLRKGKTNYLGANTSSKVKRPAESSSASTPDLAEIKEFRLIQQKKPNKLLVPSE